MGSSKRIRDVIEPFREWLGARVHTIDVEWVAMLLDLKESHLDSADPCTWHTGDIERLLLSVVPRKVIDDDPGDGSTAEALEAYLAFLHDTGRLGVGSAPYVGLVRELEAALEEYPDALADSSRWGVGKSIMGAASAAGIDPSAPGGVEAMMEYFNALPDAERDRILSGAMDGGAPFELPDEDEELDELDVLNAEIMNVISGVAQELPLVRLGSEAELASDALGTPTLQRLHQLVDAVRPGLRVTTAETLTTEHAIQVARALELTDQHGRTIDKLSETEDVRVFPPLDRLWTIGLESELLSIRGVDVEPAPDVVPFELLSDGELLELWESAADAALGWWVLEDQPRSIGVALHWILARAYAARAGVRLDEGLLRVEESLDQPYDEAGRAAYLDALRTAVDCLADVGYVVVESDASTDPNVVPPPTAPDSDAASGPDSNAVTVRLTRLGDYAMSGRLEMAGLDPLTLGPTEELDAIDLVDVWPVLPEADACDLLAEWVALRDCEPAVTLLLEEAARTELPAQRALALVIAEKIDGPDVVDAYRRAVEVPALRPYAHNWLFRHGFVHAPYAQPEDRAYMVVDGLAGLMGLVGPEEAADELDRMIEPAEQLAFLSAVWRCDHPELLAVLTVVGDRHPDPAIRKAARKSLFKARTYSVTTGQFAT